MEVRNGDISKGRRVVPEPGVGIGRSRRLNGQAPRLVAVDIPLPNAVMSTAFTQVVPTWMYVQRGRSGNLRVRWLS